MATLHLARRLLLVLACIVGCSADEPSDETEPADGPVAPSETASNGLVSADGVLTLEASGRSVRVTSSGADVVALETISAGPAALDGAWQLQGNALSQTSHGVTELWDVTRGGLRQSWQFESDPMPGSDLVVDVAVYGATAVASDDQGVLLVSEDGEQALRYSHAVWIDARGRETPVAVGHYSTGLEIRVPADVLAESTFPAWLDPTLSSSFQPEPPVVEPWRSYNRYAITCEGTNCFAGFSTDTPYSLRNSRVTETGTLVTPISEQVGSLSDLNFNDFGDVARLNQTLLFVWNANNNVIGQRVATSGALLGGPITVATGVGSRARVVASDTQFLVAWGGGIRRLNESGAFLAAVQSAPLPADFEPASDGTTFAFGYNFQSGFNTFNGVTIADALGNTSDVFVGQAGIGCFTYEAPHIGYDGSSYVLLFKQADQTLASRRLSAGGVFLDTPQTVAPAACWTTDIACGTGECFASWFSNGFGPTSLNGRPIIGGTPVGAPVVVATGLDGTNVQLARSATTYHAIWRSPGSEALMWTPVTLTGVAQYPAGMVISNRARQLYSPQAAVAPSGNLLTYQVQASDTCRTVLVDAAGNASTPVDAVASCNSAHFLEPVGGGYFLGYGQSGTAARLQRLDASGSPAGAALTLAPFSTLDATTLGNEILVAHSTNNVTMARYDAGGSPLGSATVFPGRSARVAATPTGAVIAYTDQATGSALRIRSMDTSGALGPVTNLAGAELLDVAYGGGIAAVGWINSGTVYLQRFDANAQPLDVFATTVGIVSANDVTVAWDGAGFLVAAGLSARRYFLDGSPDGPLFSLGPATQNAKTSMAIAPSATGSRMFAASTVLDGALNSNRVHYRYIESQLGPGSSCTQNGSCASGFCVDGVCCQTQCGSGAVDCQACSVAAGGTVNGTCTALAAPASVACRPSVGVCDVAETCGSTTTCPADAAAPAGSACGPSTSACHLGDQCSGTIGATAVCQPVPQPAGTQCRAGSGTCNPAESCNGSLLTCPPETNTNGQSCSDGSACTTTDVCAGGACTAGPALSCDDQEECTNEACDVALGCQYTNVTDGTGCDDDDACTLTDGCLGGACVGSAIDCDDSDVCTVDSCDSASGCTYDDAPLGTDCDDDDACTEADGCSGGVCGGTPVDCDDGDPCTVDSCDSASGCINEIADDGTECESDDLCALAASCSAGVCVVETSKECPASECNTSACDPDTGDCNDEPLPDGTKCRGGTCENGDCATGEGGAGQGGANQGGAGDGASAEGGTGTGANTGTGGSDNATGGAGATPEAPEDGCSCRTSASVGTTAKPLGLMALLLGLAARRRQRIRLVSR